MGPEQCQPLCEILAELFPHSDLVKCGITIPQFSKIAAFYIESLKKRVPKATLAQHFDDITSSRKKRLDWLTCWGKQRISQFYGEACAEVSRKQREEKHALGCAEGIGEQEMVGQLQGLPPGLTVDIVR